MKLEKYDSDLNKTEPENTFIQLSFIFEVKEKNI